MIKSFADKKTRMIWEGKRTPFETRLQRKAMLKLSDIHSVKDVKELIQPSSNKLEKLTTGFWSIRVNNQYRITFLFENGDAYEVRFYDYH